MVSNNKSAYPVGDTEHPKPVPALNYPLEEAFSVHAGADGLGTQRQLASLSQSWPLNIPILYVTIRPDFPRCFSRSLFLSSGTRIKIHCKTILAKPILKVSH